MAAQRRKAEPEYLTSAEVAALTSFSPKTLRNWRVLRKGPRFTGEYSTVRYEKAEVERWMATREDIAS